LNPGEHRATLGDRAICAKGARGMGLLQAPKIDIGGYGLTTANILYRMPDHPAVLQTYVWQDFDVAPLFPELRQFLDFWKRELDGALHSVRVAHRQLLTEGDLRTLRGVAAEFSLN
jgi:uncharacterized protein Usg